ncbi:MAG TPA: CDP-alcohol phosphatidyltransferase family protein [Verrucomicrobiae bacterium]|nr:CDP-alcohol phosphatidyltransferase family protein [Verrucomicrobiae bacterium]
MAGALLYVPDAESAALASTVVAGRPLALRAAVAAARAGATVIGIPAGLRTARLERLIGRTRDLRGRVRWLDGAGSALEVAGRGALFLPASTLLDARTLGPLLADPPEAAGAVLTEAGAPVLLLTSEAARQFAPAVGAGRPLGAELARHVAATRPKPLSAAGLCLVVRDAGDVAEAERLLYAGLGTDNDTGVDQYLHRRASRWITRALVRTPATPNQVSGLSLVIGLGAVWCFWHGTAASAAGGVLAYALACIVDHSDGELARLTFQESRFGAHLDWAIDTVIHSGLVLAMAIGSGRGWAHLVIGLVGASGVALSALFARYLPREIAVGETVGGALKNMGNRDLFYALLLVFVALRAALPAALPILALVVALGSQSYWVACVGRIRRSRSSTR